MKPIQNGINLAALAHPGNITPGQTLPGAGEILESITDGFFALDRNWCFTCVNRRAADNLGLKPADLIGHDFWKTFPGISAAHEENYRKVMTGREPRSFETHGIQPGKWYGVRAYPSSGGISVYWQDITEQKRAETFLKEALDELETRVSARTSALLDLNTRLKNEIDIRTSAEKELTLQAELLNMATDVIYLRDSRGTMIYTNDTASRLYGYSKEELQQMTLHDLMAPERVGFIGERTAEITAKKDITFETLHRRKDGTVFPVEIHSRSIEMDGRPLILGVIRDITRRKKAEDELRKVPLRLLEAQEKERHAIGRELFDQTGQYLTAIKLLLARMKMQPEMAAAHIGEAYAVVNELVEQIRNLSLDLRPPMLDNLGLLASLTWHIGRYTAETGIKVNLYHADLEREFPDQVALAAYRIVQEALLNAAKYAAVKEIDVSVAADAGALRLSVSDRGQGFDLTGLAPEKATGLGLMRERARLLGGRFKIVTATGKGTCVTAELPLKCRE